MCLGMKMSDQKWLIGSDFHFPYHDRRALDIWMRTVKMWKPDIIDLVGDIDDAQCASRFADGSVAEVTEGLMKYNADIRKFLQDMRDEVPDAEIVFFGGNHEERLWKYTGKNAKAFEGLITPQTVWGLDDLGIHYIPYSRPPTPRYGDLFLHHGMYAPAGSGKAASKTMDKFHISIVQGHTHRQAYVPQSFPIALQQDLRGYELGHMADIDSPGMAYDWQHDWQQGFATARIDSTGYPHVNLVSINRDYRAYVEGTLVAA